MDFHVPFCGLHVLPECDYVDGDFAEFCVGRLKGSSLWGKSESPGGMGGIV